MRTIVDRRNYSLFQPLLCRSFVDKHAAAISIASLAASDKMTPQEAVLPILAAMTSNTVAKIAMAIGGGSRAFALRITPGLVAPIAAAWAVAVLTVMR